MPKKESRLTVCLFGAPRVTLDDAPIETARRKTLALLVYLAFHSNQPHTRESLAALFWAEQSQERAFANLRHALWEINQALGDGWMDSDRDEIRLTGEIDLDVTRFRALLAASRDPTPDSASRFFSLAQAASLYTDHFLAGFTLKDAPAFDDWAFFQSESLRRDLASALETLSRVYCDLNRAAEAIPFARRWLALDVLNESAHRQLTIAYELAGEHASALRQYQQCEATLQKELDVEPEAETKALYEKIRAGGLQGKPSARNNLPSAVTSFIGRENEAERVRSELAQNRLVTLTGSGGVGKTRLAIEAARGLLVQFPQGAWLVELASITEADLIPRAVAGALEVEHNDPDALFGFLRDRAALILLDNCEHLIDGAAKFAARLLASCPNVRVLATSRESLGIEGEFALRVPSLETTDAARLFAERARLVQPSFVLDASNASVIAEICARLDGIPLALELAASRVKMLSLEQILARLDNAIALLTGGSRAALPRQQTLRAAIDWSYNLLPESEQSLFRHLSVFTGGWTLDAAEAICCDDGESKESTLDLLTQLANKSLIHVDVVRIGNPQTNELAGYHPAPRFFMLETIRQYAQEKLKTLNEDDRARESHARWCLEFAESAEPFLCGRKQVEMLNMLETNHENFRAALDWSLTFEQTEIAVRLAGVLFEFWRLRGYSDKGVRWLNRTLEAANRKTAFIDAQYFAKIHLALGLPSMGKGCSYSEETHYHAEKAVNLYERLKDPHYLGYALHAQTCNVWLSNDVPQAQELCEQSLAIRMAEQDAWGIGNSLHTLAHLSQEQGDFEKARLLFEQCVGYLRKSGDLFSLMHPLTDMGWFAWHDGDTLKARAMFAENIEGYCKLGDQSGVNWLQCVSAEAAISQCDFDAARTHLEAALSEARSRGDKNDIMVALNV